mgnify:CR=1 FL=1
MILGTGERFTMYKWTYFVVFIAAGLLGLAALITNVAESAKQRAEEEAAGPTLTLVATNWQFDKSEYVVKAGETMTVRLVNKEGLHQVKIQGFDFELTKANPAAEVTFDQPGTYIIECTLPCGQGHDNMKATLVVE